MLVENIATTEFFWKQNLGYTLKKKNQILSKGKKFQNVHDYTKITP